MFLIVFRYSSNESSFSDEHLQTTSSTFNFESSEENKSDNFKSFENFKFPESSESTVSSEEQSTSIVLEHKESDTKNYHYTTNVKKEPVGGNSVNSTPSTKKAKSLDVDDAMNVNTKIPDYTEVWALASGLWAPNNTRKAQPSYQTQTTDDYLNVNQETSNSPESLLVKWSEVMKIMNNKTTPDKIGNQSKRVFANNELNEDDKVIKPSIPLSTSTLAPNLDNNRIDLDNQEQRINETIVMERPKNHNYQIAPKTIDKTVEIFDVTSETNRNLDRLRVSEPESTLDVETTTTEIIETTTETDVSELSTESDGFTTTEETTTDFMDSFTLLGEDDDEPDDAMSKRTVPTEITTTETPSSTEKPIQTTTEINPSINEIPESTERYNKSSSTPQKSSSISVPTDFKSTAMPRSLEMTDSPTEAPEISTTTSNIIEFKPMSSESPHQPKVLQNDTEKYEYDLLPQSSSTTFTTRLPTSTFSYPKSSIPIGQNIESTSTTDNSIYQENAGNDGPMNVTYIVIISIIVACAVILAFVAVFWVSFFFL